MKPSKSDPITFRGNSMLVQVGGTGFNLRQEDKILQRMMQSVDL